MDKENDIFFQLKEHEVNPPPELLIAILDRINKEKDDELKSLFGKLSQYEVAPPSFLTVSKLKDQPAQTETPGKIISLSSRKNGYRYVAAAAAVLALAGAWALYSITGSPTKNEIAAVPEPQKIIETPIVEKKDSSPSIANLTPPVHRRKKWTARPNDFFYTNNINIGETTFPLVDDDLLSTFASFTYEQVPDYLLNTSTEKALIRTDMYTSINISREMRSMMKKMYQVKRNGRSTHKARKQKRKLAGWQKADAKYFDKKLDKNPVDMIDLADFIFDK